MKSCSAGNPTPCVPKKQTVCKSEFQEFQEFHELRDDLGSTVCVASDCDYRIVTNQQRQLATREPAHSSEMFLLVCMILDSYTDIFCRHPSPGRVACLGALVLRCAAAGWFGLAQGALGRDEDRRVAVEVTERLHFWPLVYVLGLPKTM